MIHEKASGVSGSQKKPVAAVLEYPLRVTCCDPTLIQQWGCGLCTVYNIRDIIKLRYLLLSAECQINIDALGTVFTESGRRSLGPLHAPATPPPSRATHSPRFYMINRSSGQIP